MSDTSVLTARLLELAEDLQTTYRLPGAAGLVLEAVAKLDTLTAATPAEPTPSANDKPKAAAAPRKATKLGKLTDRQINTLLGARASADAGNADYLTTNARTADALVAHGYVTQPYTASGATASSARRFVAITDAGYKFLVELDKARTAAPEPTPATPADKFVEPCGKELAGWPYGNCTESTGHVGDCDRRTTRATRAITNVMADALHMVAGEWGIVSAHAIPTTTSAALVQRGLLSPVRWFNGYAKQYLTARGAQVANLNLPELVEYAHSDALIEDAARELVDWQRAAVERDGIHQ
jgi:hypothetical protein